MSENWQSRTTHRIRRFILNIAQLLLVFLFGFVPTWLKSRKWSSRLAEAERLLSLTRMENSLVSAALDAWRGDYETARLAASGFFTSLRTELNRGVDSALSQEEIASLQPLLARRDEIITLLARGDTASADLLSDLCVSYRQLMNP